ncbi:cell division protein FtsK [Streptococcus minor]|uniref:Cell division protein FtsK n=1 Tax=Streptococcus minor TaxID=229549 RepID=A0A3P1VB96_9STRE|nr:FtsK/SpoIIIE domain-containing protein [Streptococcus minor]RRD31492.1 cell division protein FtsK [Streptococcus minor]
MSLRPRFRGIRVRPFMRFARQILFCILLLIGYIPIGFYGYTNKSKLIEIDIPSISILVILVVFWFIVSFWFSLILIEQTVLFAKWDRYARFARFLWENRIVYERKKSDGSISRKFPRIYLKQNKFDLEVTFELAGSKFQQKFKQIGGELETTFAMDFMETEDDDRFKTYRLAYSSLLNRIKILEVGFSYERGVQLMKNFYWDFLSDPHLLVAGGTGGGKTVFLNGLILCLAKHAVVEICDPKRADFVTLVDIPAFEGRVAFETEDIIQKFEQAEKDMYERYNYMRSEMAKAGEKDLRKFYEYGLEPYFLVCDEYNSLVNSLGYKDRERLERALIKLSLLGRQSGVNVILAMQKPTAEDIPTKVRDNMNMRICVGRLSDLGYNMMFGEVNRTKEFKFVKFVGGMRVFGRGYGAVNGEVAREFYSPLLTKGLSFHDEYAKLDRHEKLIVSDVTGQAIETVLNDSVKDDFETVMEEKTLKEWSVQTGNNLKSAKRLVDLLEEAEKWSFTRDSDAQVLLAMEDELLLQKLFEQRSTTTLKWREIVDLFDYGSL